ncbi:MAG: glycosyltransferase [Bacteroidetes bacterium]|nr:glycosyltransferase [Bacteroidota bacterium]
MIILVNTATTFKGGGVQVAKSLIEEFKNFAENDYHIVLGVMLSEIIEIKSLGENFHFYNIGYRPASSISTFRKAQKYLNALEQKINPDVVITTSGPAYWNSKKPHIIGYNLPHYIYFDSPFFKIISASEKLKWRFKGLLINYFFKRDADVLVVQTEDIKHRLAKKWPYKKVTAVSNTYSASYDNPVIGNKKLPERKNDEFRLLTLSAWYKHKNLSIIIKLIDVMPPALLNRIRFVVTLPPSEFDLHFPKSYQSFILNVGPVSPVDGASLYAECDAMFLPTLLECFSASYAEAMAMKKPILTSDLGFAHTVCDEAALYFDPMNPQSIINAIASLIDNTKLKNTLIANGVRRLNYFGTAKQRAEQYLSICKEAIHVN